MYTVQSLFKQANQLYRTGNYEQALVLYQQLYTDNPYFQPYALNLSLTLRRIHSARVGHELLLQVYQTYHVLAWKRAKRLIRLSGLFDKEWYAQHYADWQPKDVDPVLHYVCLGWRLGCSPSPQFDNQAYLQRFYKTDRSYHLSPLLHYLTQKSKAPAQHQPLGRLKDQLWGGHSSAALIQLEQVAADPLQPKENRWWALWHQACWFYFNGQIAQALDLALQMQTYIWGHRQRKEGVYLRYFCLCLLGRYEEAYAELEMYMRLYPQDTDALLAWSNSAANDNDRLYLINKAYALAGWAGIEKKDPAQPLALNNIQGLPAVRVDEPEKVSIIMPIYKAADQVQVAIQSLLAQSYRNIEIIAVDDCSPDQTFKVLQDLAQSDSRIKAIQMPVNGGAYAARNYGLALAVGDFVTTHDSDDWSHPQKIEAQVAYLKKHEQVMGCVVHWVRAEPNLQFTQNWRPEGSLTHWSHSSFMFRKQVPQELGGWDLVRIGADTEYIWRMQAHFGKASFAKIQADIPLAFALDEASSLTRTKATHVRTVYFGLRHIYRQVAAWWQRYQPSLKLSANEKERPFKAPRAMWDKQTKTLHYQLVIAGDFSRLADIEQAALLIHQNSNKAIALFHWPSFGRAAHSLGNLYFELLCRDGVEPVVAGQTVQAPNYYLTRNALIDQPLDAYPEWIGLKKWTVLLERDANECSATTTNVD